jgi:hypothetical protein
MMPEGFIPLEQVIAESGVCREAVRRRLHRIGVPTYTNPFDRRRRLIRAEDYERVQRPSVAYDSPTMRRVAHV